MLLVFLIYFFLYMFGYLFVRKASIEDFDEIMLKVEIFEHFEAFES